MPRMPALAPFKFVRGFVARPRQVGAIMPSSPRLAAAMVQGLKLTPTGSVIEFGPGTGPFTRALLAAQPAGGRYLGIELDPEFHAHLRQHFPAADFAHASATDAFDLHAQRDMPPTQAIVCGLPFASLPASVQDGVVSNIDRLLSAGGTFRTFQYLHAFNMANAKAFRRRMDQVFGPGRCVAKVLRNVPPACVMSWTR